LPKLPHRCEDDWLTCKPRWRMLNSILKASAVEGPQADVTFTNATDGDLSLYLYSYKTKFGCGVGNVSLEPLDAVTVTVPKGCYDFYGWVTGPKDSTPAGYGCLNFDQTVTVKQDTLVFPSQK